MITYAQNFEDVMLERLFAECDRGFYVDIGAGHPTYLSVTRHFYERGWRGVNVEPLPRNWEAFVRERPRDTNLNVAVGTRPGMREFCEVLGNDALSSMDEARVAQLRGSDARTVVYPVECVTGDSILDRCPEPVDFLKIDVEGAEEDVLRSIDLARHRPKVLVIEATTPVDEFPGWDRFSPESHARWSAWEPIVLQAGYRFAHFDGLNRFYLRADLEPLAARLALPPGVFDRIVPDLEEALNAKHRATEAAFRSALDGKEAEIRLLKDVPSGPSTTAGEAHLALVRQVEEKQRIIEELDGALSGYRRAFAPVMPIARPFLALAGVIHSHAVRCRRLVTPKLGRLEHHEPIVARLPKPYTPPEPLSDLPRIALVTPSYGQAAFIERTIRSVLDQGYPNLAYFIQDGGSGDGTVGILERYGSRLAGWDSRPDGGQSQAINRGFERVDGEIMAWLNSDDILLPGALAFVADWFVRHPGVDVIYGHRMLIDEDDREIGRWVLPPHDDRILSWADYVPQETLFWRRRIWDKVGARIDESFRFAMDWDLLVRFREAGARFERVPRFLGGFRIHERQKTSAAISDVGFREMTRIRERVLGHVPSRGEIARAVAPYLARHVASDLAWRVRFRLGAE